MTVKEIIDLLSDDSKSLTTPLLKTQVLASRIGNDDLYEWVSKELNGFGNNDPLPEHRIAKTNPMGTLTTGYYSEENAALPVSVFGDKIAEWLIKFRIDSGIKSIEEVATGKYGDTIVKPLPADFCAMLTQEAKKNGYNLRITDGRVLVHLTEYVNALGKIRATLLDLILKVEKQFPDIDTIIDDNNLEEKSKVNRTITHIMTQINVHSSGSGNVVTTGDNNNVTANINIGKDDLDGLRNELLKHHINVEDVNEIIDIVQHETPIQNEFGQNVKNWLSKMVNKSINGGWEIGVATAGGLLVEILKKYYGL
ncbi:MAG: hypothetical protein JWQ63_4356 [Mucilaginibacter sp.]|nr:hypothetical protein [Mucilaginibacter sp.]